MPAENAQPGFKRELRIKLASAIGAGVLFLALAIWLSITAKQLSATIALTRLEIAEQKISLANLALLTQEAQRADEFLPRLKLLLPDTEQLLVISSELETFAETSGLGQSFSFGSETPGNDKEPKSLGLNIVLLGSLRDFVDYLRKIEDVPYTLNFSGIEAIEQGGRYQINVVGKIYTR